MKAVFKNHPTISVTQFFKERSDEVYKQLRAGTTLVSDLSDSCKITLESTLDCLVYLQMSGRAQQTNNGWTAL